MTNAFGGTNLVLRETYENWLSGVLANKDKGFYDRGIKMLDYQWQRVTEQNDAYLT